MRATLEQAAQQLSLDLSPAQIDDLVATFGLDLPLAQWAAEDGIANEEIQERLLKAADARATEREQMISAYSELVGLDPVSLGDGVAEVRLPMAAHLRNRGGVMHGGALFSLMDVTMGLACSSSHGFDRQSVTLECKINYIRAVADGEVRCVARVLHAGRRSLVVEAEVRQGDKLVAKGQGTFAQL